MAALQDDLAVKAPLGGWIAQAGGLHGQGRFVRKGEPLATISAGSWILKAVATETTISCAMPALNDPVRVRLVGHAGTEFDGTIVGLARAGSRRVEAAPLTHLGGGTITVAPETMEAQEPFFTVTIALDNGEPGVVRHGMVAMAVFGSPRVPLGLYLYRRTLLFVHRLRLGG